MKRLVLPIAASLLANVLLAAIYFASRPSPVELSAAAETSSSDTSKALKPLANAVSSATPTPLPKPVIAPEEPMRWDRIASKDLKEMIRRLRAVDCPKQTIEDIILAEVNRLYSARQRAIWDYAKQQEEYWKSNQRSNKDQRDRSKQYQALQKEKSALLVELLGEDPEKKRRLEEGYQDYQDQRLAGIPKDKQDAVTAILDAQNEKMQEFYEKTRGMWDAEARLEQRKLQEEQLQALASVLTPEELRNWEVRNGQHANQLQNDLQGFNPSEKEYLALYDIRKEFGDSVYNYGDIETKEDRDKVTAAQKAQSEAIAAALGPERAKEYERGKDYSFQQLARLADRMDLPADSAKKVYDYKEVAENAVKDLRANKDLTNEQRQQALAKVREETEAAIKETIGQEGLKRYRNSGGWWINNLAPAPRPAPRN